MGVFLEDSESWAKAKTSTMPKHKKQKLGISVYGKSAEKRYKCLLQMTQCADLACLNKNERLRSRGTMKL
jgi:hypothetical protein